MFGKKSNGEWATAVRSTRADLIGDGIWSAAEVKPKYLNFKKWADIYGIREEKYMKKEAIA